MLTLANASKSGKQPSRYAIRPPGGSFPRIAPIYTTPTGMTYNPITDRHEGTVCDTTYNPPSDNIVYITDSGDKLTNQTNLQSAIDAAGDLITGTTIVVPAGCVVRGGFYLQGRPVGWTGWIYIISSAMANLPANSPGDQGSLEHRVKPFHLPYMWVIETPDVGYDGIVGIKSHTTPEGVYVNDSTGKHSGYWLDGVEIRPSVGMGCERELINLGDTSGGSYGIVDDGTMPDGFVLNRSYLHGDLTATTCKRGVKLTGANACVINSHISEIKGIGWETQAVWIHTGPGPFKIDNNYLEGTTENFMIGGASGHYPDIPSNIQFTNNHVRKRPSWNQFLPTYGGVDHSIKNLFELKKGRYVLIEGNVFDGMWQDGQPYAFNFKTTSQSGSTPWVITRDVTMRHNVVINIFGMLSMSGNPENDISHFIDDGGPARRIDIHNNIFVEYLTDGQGGPVSNNTRNLLARGGVNNTRIVRNTFIDPTCIRTVQLNDQELSDDMIFNDNVFYRGSDYGFYAGGGSAFNSGAPSTSDGEPVVQYLCGASSQVRGNAIINLDPEITATKRSALEASGNTVVDNSNDHFENLYSYDFRIKDPAFYTCATDGTTPGANIAEVIRLLDTVRSTEVLD